MVTLKAGGRIDRCDPLSPRLTEWLPLSELHSYYEILRHERHVHLVGEREHDGYLSQLHFGTAADAIDSAPDEPQVFGAAV